MSTRTARSPRLRADQRRAQLLDVTRDLAAAQGFHAVSIEAVAREAGVSRPIVYDHFRDLQGLFESLIERESERALSQLAAVLPTDLSQGDPRALLLGAFRQYLGAVQAEPARWRLVLVPVEGAPALLRDQIDRTRAAVVAGLAEAVRHVLGPGREPPDPELTARTLSAAADEAARLLLVDPERYGVERLLAHAGWLLDQVRWDADEFSGLT